MPRILVGTKKDLRHDEATLARLVNLKGKPVTTEDGQNMASRVNAARYIECSAKTREGVQEVFEAAARSALVKKRKSSGFKCSIL